MSLDILRADGSHVAVLGSRPFTAGLAEFSWDGRIGGVPAPAGVYIASVRRDGMKPQAHRFVVSPQ